MNRAYGCWAQFSGDGEWAQSNNHVQPRSIFYAQLEERLQRNVQNVPVSCLEIQVQQVARLLKLLWNWLKRLIIPV